MSKKSDLLHLFAFVVIGIWCFSCTPTKTETPAEKPEEATSEDPLILEYKDSLNKYFGLVEIDLIRQYKVNHENLRNEDEFYNFYRNAVTLKKTLTRDLNRLAKQRINKNLPLFDFKWLEEITEGYEVEIIKGGTSYAIFFDYTDLEEHAKQTTGNHDDEFVALLEMAYDSTSHHNKWSEVTAEGVHCSLLGSNKHYEILKQSNLTLEGSRKYFKEVHKVQKAIINDILFREAYCMDLKKVLEEIDKIMTEIKFEGSELDLLKIRRGQLANHKESNITMMAGS